MPASQFSVWVDICDCQTNDPSLCLRVERNINDEFPSNQYKLFLGREMCSLACLGMILLRGCYWCLTIRLCRIAPKGKESIGWEDIILIEIRGTAEIWMGKLTSSSSNLKKVRQQKCKLEPLGKHRRSRRENFLEFHKIINFLFFLFPLWYSSYS